MLESTATDRRIAVSVIIPTYNRAHCVSEAIDSVLAQDPPADEVIVIDDGSTDNTPEVLQAYGDKIKPFRQENKGVGAARNVGMHLATGEWVAFLDSDDIWYPGRLRSLLRDITESSPKVVAHTGNLVLTGEGYELDYFSFRKWQFPTDSAKLVIDPLPLTMSGVFPQGTALRRGVAIDAGGYSEEMKIYEDAYLFTEMSLRGYWLVTADCLANVRRLLGDSAALSNLESSNTVEAATARVSFMANIYNKELSKEQKKFVGAALSGAQFALAAARQRAQEAGERDSLVKSIAYHPSKFRGSIKALIALTLRSFGYDLIHKGKRKFSRSKKFTHSQFPQK